MSASKNNIQFNYKYRDAGNYKVFGHVVFTNPDECSLDFIENKLRASLIDSEFFDPKDWKLPRLKFDDWVPDLDHTWNEYENVEYTSEPPTQEKSITEFLEFVSKVPRYY